MKYSDKALNTKAKSILVLYLVVKVHGQKIKCFQIFAYRIKTPNCRAHWSNTFIPGINEAI